MTTLSQSTDWLDVVLKDDADRPAIVNIFWELHNNLHSVQMVVFSCLLVVLVCVVLKTKAEKKDILFFVL